MLFDSHAHYEDARFDEDREDLLRSLAENGIDYVVNVSSSVRSIEETLRLAGRYDFVHAAIGVHPENCDELDEETFARVREAAREPKVVAIGEIGLDYSFDQPGRDTQKKWMERQVEWAKEERLPMIVHSRDAARDTLDMVRALHGEEAGGVIHCFSYGTDIAREYLKMGFFLGIGGVVTFKNGRKLREVVDYAPIESILLETDCPYLAPEPNRGKRNSSLNLIYVAQEIARIKGMRWEDVARVTEENAKRMYRIP